MLQCLQTMQTWTLNEISFFFRKLFSSSSFHVESFFPIHVKRTDFNLNCHQRVESNIWYYTVKVLVLIVCLWIHRYALQCMWVLIQTDTEINRLWFIFYCITAAFVWALRLNRFPAERSTGRRKRRYRARERKTTTTITQRFETQLRWSD